MATIVCKFGGSSLAGAACLKRVAEQVIEFHRRGDSVVVVVSAMGKTTDTLLAQAREVSVSPPSRELDMLVTAGERVSMALLSMAIATAGGSAVSLTGSQCGIITDTCHADARILEIRPRRLRRVLAAGHIAIVAGYQGVSVEGEVTTLGRGGSDTTAVALAGALGAATCRIFSDVDGVYSTDPRDCLTAQHLPQLDYAFMTAMAAQGARVLNGRAVEMAREAGVTIEAARTGDASGRVMRVAAGPVAGLWAVVAHRSVARTEDGRYAPMRTGETTGLGMVSVLCREGASEIVDRAGSALARSTVALLATQAAPEGQAWIVAVDDVQEAVGIAHACGVPQAEADAA